MSGNDTPNKNSDMIIYTTEDGLTKIETTFDGDTVWLSKAQMAELFQRDRSVISKHIKNVFKEGELPREGNVQILHIANSDKPVEFYNLDVIISVGYRVKSKRGTQFRIWATGILKEYMRKGFALDDERLKNLGGGGYFKELLERIRDIRASEKVFYRQVLEIYATSIDYDPKAEISIQFFKKVQNKIHYAIHGQTAAEVIYTRADAESSFCRETEVFPTNRRLIKQRQNIANTKPGHSVKWNRTIWIRSSNWNKRQIKNRSAADCDTNGDSDMKKEKTKVYIYTRVSTAMQIDGYSLDAQKARMKAFAEYNDYEIAGEYEDAGKSGKSIEGRIEFNHMLEDIKSGKDGVSYVLVFKLSRFGRNAADVLSALQVMQNFGVNLICVEDGIDSSKDAGKLMISVLSAVAEIERENIRVQTMEGRIQKAREGKWNGGFAPYGYTLERGKLIINEEEAEAIRIIFDQYVHTDMGANGLAKYLANHGIGKIQRQNGKNPLFDAALIRRILKNPVYCGKIAYGRRRTEKVHGTRNDYRLVEQDDYLLANGLHEGIVSEELWHEAQVKLLAQAEKYEHVNRGKDTKVHLLSGIVKCPICGAGMYGNKSIKRKPDGAKYKDFFYYGCKHRTMTRGHKCDYKKQINEELLDDAVAEVIAKLVSNPKFAALMQQKISMKVDTTAIEQEISVYEKQLRQSYSTKSKLIEEMDSLDPDDRHYIKRKSDLDERLYRMYDKIENIESLLTAARAKKMAIEAEKLTSDNIYKVLIYFDKLYGAMNDQEKRQIMEALISEIQIYEERQPNGQWIKSIRFRLPIIEEDMNLSLDNDEYVETVVLMSRVNNKVKRRKVRL